MTKQTITKLMLEHGVSVRLVMRDRDVGLDATAGADGIYSISKQNWAPTRSQEEW